MAVFIFDEYKSLFLKTIYLDFFERSGFMKKLIALVSVLSMLFCGCSTTTKNDDVQTANDKKDVEVTDKLSNEEIDSLDNTLVGFGQGVEVNEKNVPTGAIQFNEKYKDLSAYSYNEDEAKITLTFDQGYENGYTSQILDTLKEKKVHAVFFVLLDYAEKNPELIKRMIDEGHTVANHSATHPSFPSVSTDEMIDEVMQVHDYMKENYNYEMTLFRFPKGEFSQKSLGVVKNCGYESVFWSFAYADWDVNNQPDETQALEKIVGGAHEGAIYLLHSVSKTNADVLGDAIDKIREKGFEFK